MTYKGVVFDFDYTLAHHTDKFSHFFEILRAEDIREEHLHKTFLEVCHSDMGFTLPYFLKALGIPPGDLIERLEQALFTHLVLYPDTREVLNALHNQGIPTAIITAGNSEYQKSKMAHVGLSLPILVSSPTSSKGEHLETLVDVIGAPLLYVDDAGHQLDRIYEHDSLRETVTRLKILRPDSEYRGYKSRYAHETIHSLSEIFSFLEETDANTPSRTR